MTYSGFDFENLQGPGNRVAAGQAFTIACTIGAGRVFVPRHTHLARLVTHADDVQATVANCDMASPFIYQARSSGSVVQVVRWKLAVLHDTRQVTWELPNLRFSTACIGLSYQLAVKITALDPTTKARVHTTLSFRQTSRVSKAVFQIRGSQAMAAIHQPFSAAHVASGLTANAQKTILGAPQNQLTMGGANTSRVVEAHPEQRKNSGGERRGKWEGGSRKQRSRRRMDRRRRAARKRIAQHHGGVPQPRVPSV